MKSVLKIFIPVVISGFFLWIVLKGFNPSDLKQALLNANWSLISIALATYPTGFIIRTLRWKVLLKRLASPSGPKTFSVLTFGFLVNNVLPARAGEFARAYAGGKEFGIPVASCLGTIAIERLTDLFALSVFFLISLFVVEIPGVPIGKILGIMGLGLLVAFVGFFGLRKKIRKVIATSTHPMVKKIFSVFSQFLEGFSVVGSFRLLALGFGLALLIWTLETVSIFIIAKGFGFDLSPLQGTVILVGLAAGAMIPAAPGYIGTVEFFGERAMNLMGYTGGTVISFVLFLHFFQFMICSLMGFPYLVKIGFIPKKDKKP